MKRFFTQAGLTLLELIIVIALVAVSLSFLSPATESLLRKNRAETEQMRIAKLMSFARSTAINRNTSVTLCSLSSESNCELPWRNSLSVFEDHNENGKQDPGEAIIRTTQLALANWNHRYRPSVRSYFQWGATGTSNGTAGSVEFCSPDHLDSGFAIIVSFAGRIRLSRDFDGDGIQERNPGTAIAC